MKGKMKKILGLAISAAMAVSAVMPWTGVTAFAEGEAQDDNSAAFTENAEIDAASARTVDSLRISYEGRSPIVQFVTEDGEPVDDPVTLDNWDAVSDDPEWGIFSFELEGLELTLDPTQISLPDNYVLASEATISVAASYVEAGNILGFYNYQVTENPVFEVTVKKAEPTVQTVYVYVDNNVTSDFAELNPHGYYTVGTIQLELPEASSAFSKENGAETYNEYQEQIGAALENIKYFPDNASWFDLDEIDVNWYTLHTDAGADDYPDAPDCAWHLDGAINEEVTYTVTFDANGGTFNEEDLTEIHVSNLVAGAPIPLPGEESEPKREGFDFIGWSLEKENGTPGDSFSIPSAGGDVTLYAVWEPTQVTGKYSVEFQWEFDADEGIERPDIERPSLTDKFETEEAARAAAQNVLSETYDDQKVDGGTWTFNEWDNGTTRDTIVTFTGTWTFEADEEPPVVEPGDDNVDLDKTATGLVDDTTDVTLSIGATEGKDKVAVMFILDYSTSVNVRDAAADMLDELKTKENTDVKVCVINYWADADKGKWITLTSETDTNDLLKATQTGGTNIHGGLLTAEEALESSEIEDYETYLITISDGLTYLWSDDEGETQSVWFQTGANGEDSIQNGNSVIEMKYPAGASQSSKIPDEIFDALVTGNQSIIEKYDNTVPYFTPYSEPFSDGRTPYISFQPDWVADDGKTAKDFLIGTEIAIYKSADVFNRLVGSVDHVITLKKDENHWGQYPYGEQLMNWMISQSGDGSGYVTDETAEEVFSGIRDLILYEIQTGTVTDVIGDDFDFAGLDTVRLTVGTDVLTGTISGNTISFDDGNYVVTYYPNGTENDSREQFKWEINVPVEAEKGVALTYTLNLVNKSTTPGSYEVPTNEEAVLDYTSTTGAENQKEFPVPEVTYTVADTSEPSDPGPDNPPYIPDGGDEEEPSEPTEEIPEEETPQTSLPTDDTSVPDAIPGEPSAPSTEEIPDNTTPQTAQPPQTGARAAGSVVLLAGAAVVAALTLRRKK